MLNGNQFVRVVPEFATEGLISSEAPQLQAKTNKQKETHQWFDCLLDSPHIYLYYLLTFLIAATKSQKKSNLKKKELIFTHSSKVESIMTGKIKWKKLDAAGHVAYAAKKQGEIDTF